jgi:acyl dehydratase
MTVKLYYEDLYVGYRLPQWSRTTDLMTWNRFAAVNDEFVYFHMDDDAGRAAKNQQGAFGMGNLRFSYLINSIRDAFGDEVLIREVGCSYRAINQKGDTLSVTAEVDRLWIEEGECMVYLVMDAVNQDGTSTCPGHSVLVVPSRG